MRPRCRRGAQRTNTAWRKPKDAAKYLLIIGYGSPASFEITACMSVHRLRTTAAACLGNRVARLSLGTSRFLHALGRSQVLGLSRASASAFDILMKFPRRVYAVP